MEILIILINLVDDLKNIMLTRINTIQQKIRSFNNNINFKNIFTYELKDNIYVYFDKENEVVKFKIINIDLKDLKKMI